MGTGNQLFESIFHRPLSGPGTQEYLEQLATDHPYFTAVHFFRLLTADLEAQHYPSTLAKASVLFNNPFWLQFQLAELDGKVPYQEEELVSIPAFVENPVLTMKEAMVIERLPIGNGGTDNNDDIPVIEQPDESPEAETPEWFIGESQPADSLPLSTEADDLLEAVKVDNLTSPGDNSLVNNRVPATKPNVDTGELLKREEDSNDSISISSVDDNDVELPVSPDATGVTLATPGPPTAAQNTDDKDKTTPTEAVNEPASNASPFISNKPGSHFNTDPSPLVNDPAAEEENEANDEEEYPEAPMVKPFNFKLDQGREQKVTEDTLTFEPLHTTDYFASLGIRLSGEVMPTDKLGKQLKSFTEWLKTMKKIHAGEVVQQGAAADKSIQHLAEQSNKEAGVLTEAMAEVLLQQGKADKAIEVYKKLSLFNPSKSAYFAAKIDQLNEH